jgi:hypothetical protein
LLTVSNAIGAFCEHEGINVASVADAFGVRLGDLAETVLDGVDSAERTDEFMRERMGRQPATGTVEVDNFQQRLTLSEDGRRRMNGVIHRVCEEELISQAHLAAALHCTAEANLPEAITVLERRLVDYGYEVTPELLVEQVRGRFRNHAEHEHAAIREALSRLNTDPVDY